MIRIVIAEDQRLLRGALASLLNLEDDLEVIGEAGDGQEALAMILNQKPDICLLDIEMPVLTGIEVAEQLQAKSSPCRIIILTTFARPGYFERSAKAGVSGYLLKDEPSDKLAESIRRVMQGHRAISPELIFDSVANKNPLTPRECDILQLISSGQTTNEIAHSLHLSHGTVRNYISEILNKLDVKNRIEAISLAEENGWI
ncbi:response regulator transcription factor [Paenibacillus sp.]|jgi:two-component system response regulator DesR|uniref:response regulator transcription factor n=1 Tax=Paenibacillus sp. TaxID=58172 RepID=UPI002820E4F4|nr:response regulator transcription factor [Paenibacillus sp.]MDR0268894.1 response regulator transcription factor [Paenibacillus sp.]